MEEVLARVIVELLVVAASAALLRLLAWLREMSTRSPEVATVS